MPERIMEFVSSHGDEPLGRMRYVVHATTNATDTVSITQAGLNFVEGQPVITSDLVLGRQQIQQSQAPNSLGSITPEGKPGTVLVFSVPQSLHVGYAAFTSVYLNRGSHQVNGSVMSYAAGRQRLSLYSDANSDQKRRLIEQEVLAGQPLEQHPRTTMPAGALVGMFMDDQLIDQALNRLNASVGSLEPINFNLIEGYLKNCFQIAEPAQMVLVNPAIHELMVGTVESMIISRLRMMRWQGLALLGYKFYEGNQEVAVPPPRDMSDQQNRIDKLVQRIIASSFFAGDLAWLRTYAMHELELMNVELRSAEL